jgi:hypothetical protein
VCALLSRYTRDFALARYIMQALKTVAVRLGLPLPDGVLSRFRDLKLTAAELADVPAAFVLPAHAEMWDVIYEEGLGVEESGVQQMGVEMGELLSQWSDLELSS